MSSRARRCRPVRLPFAEGCAHVNTNANTRSHMCAERESRRDTHMWHTRERARLFARHVCRRVASRPEFNGRSLSFLRSCRCPYDNIDKRLSGRESGTASRRRRYSRWRSDYSFPKALVRRLGVYPNDCISHREIMFQKNYGSWKNR